MNRLLLKNTLIKIRKSLGRYLSLFGIVLVGIGFLAGLRQSSPDILATAGAYAADHRLADFKIVSTMGLTDDDAAALRALGHADAVVPTYSFDVLSGGKAVRLQAIEPSVNTVSLTAGRMPRTDTECVADRTAYKLGDRVDIAGDIGGKLKNKSFTVVGLAGSPLYWWKDYGSTTVGDGRLSAFLYIDRDNFTLDAYTEIDVLTAGASDAVLFSKAYDSAEQQMRNELNGIAAKREDARYRQIHDAAAQKIADSRAELDRQEADGQKQLDSAKAKLDDSAAQLKAAESTLAKKESELQKTVAAQNAQFSSAEKQIAGGRSQIDAALRSSGIAERQLDAKISGLNASIQAMKTQQSQLPADSAAYAQIGGQLAQATAACRQLVQLQTSVRRLDEQEAQLDRGIDTFNAQIAGAKKQIAAGRATLAENKKELNDGYAAYRTNLGDFQSRISDAQKQLDDASARLSDIETPKWTVLDRANAVGGYSVLKSAVHTISSISMIFPVFFILIVILMTSNTMARMISEERGELGALVSLGVGGGRIVLSYLFYVLSATILGTAAGYMTGCTVIPKIIYACFPYYLPPLRIQYDVPGFLLVVAAAALLMSAVTVFFCRRELVQQPAALLRPVPPKSGKTILFERIGFLWKRLSFTWKVTARNLFRYKQRSFMTIIGIAGCTALLLAGFGLMDSMNGVAQKQYGSILTYRDILVLKNETQKLDGDLQDVLAGGNVRDPLLLRQTAFTCVSGEQTADAYLVVPADESLFPRYFHLTDAATGAPVPLGDGGAVISQRLASLYGLGAGGRLTVRDGDQNSYTLTVSGVVENHMENYIYVTKSLYARVFGKSAAYNMIVSDYSGSKSEVAKHFLNSDRIVGVTFADDIRNQAEDNSKSLNSVVLLLVFIASALALIVLYNLTSINISERKRQIATLKVLGFHDRETSAYIYREALILTLLSTGIGLLLGVWLLRVVIGMVENDTISFFNRVYPLSYLWASLITMGISAVMQVVTHFQLRRIKMVESLKSAE